MPTLPDYLQRWNWLYFAHHNPVLASSLLVVLGLMAGYLVYSLVFALLRRMGRENTNSVILIELLRKRCYVPGLLVFIGFGLVAFAPLAPIPKDWLGFVNRALAIYQIFVIALLLIRIIGAIRDYLYERYTNQSGLPEVRTRKALTQYRIFERIISFLIVLLAIIAALMTFDAVRQIGVSLLASAGVISVIVGFAAQRSLATVLAGVQIAIAQPIRLDDVVVVEGEWGTIEEITLTYVVIKIWDERRMVVPISYFIEKPFFNWTRTTGQISGVVHLMVDYRLPMEEFRDAFLQITHASPLWDRRRAIMQVVNMTDRVMDVRMTVSAQTAEALFDLRCYIREELIVWLGTNYPKMLPQGRVTSLDFIPPEEANDAADDDLPPENNDPSAGSMAANTSKGK